MNSKDLTKVLEFQFAKFDSALDKRVDRSEDFSVSSANLQRLASQTVRGFNKQPAFDVHRGAKQFRESREFSELAI